jgi:hypothetical protein
MHDLDEKLDNTRVRGVMIHRGLRGIFNDQPSNAQHDAISGGWNG